MEDSSQNDTSDHSVAYTPEVLGQNSQDYFREIFGIEDLGLKNGTASGSKDNETKTPPVNYCTRYKELSKNLKKLIHENELLQKMRRESENKLLRVTRDRNYLLDRLLQHEERLKNISSSNTNECKK